MPDCIAEQHTDINTQLGTQVPHIEKHQCGLHALMFWWYGPLEDISHAYSGIIQGWGTVQGLSPWMLKGDLLCVIECQMTEATKSVITDMSGSKRAENNLIGMGVTDWQQGNSLDCISSTDATEWWTEQKWNLTQANRNWHQLVLLADGIS